MKCAEYKNKILPSWIMTAKEEETLGLKEKLVYLKKVREYCLQRKLSNTTKGVTVIGPKLKRPTGAICRVVCKALAGGNVEVITDGLENIPDGAVIFASTHQGILDNFVWIPDCPKHSLLFHGIVPDKFSLLVQMNTGLIMVSKEKADSENRKGAKLDAISVLLKGHSIYICPEAVWNLSPNRLHLPLNYGFIDIAQKADVPIVPMVIEYTYDTTSEKEKITRVHIRYGELITVAGSDSYADKLEEYKEKVSTMRWELIEEKGLFLRRDISNYDYINFVKGNLRNLQSKKISIERERAGIYGANQEFYVFHHINDVPWNEIGELLGTEETERLKLINIMHGIWRK